MAYAEVQELTTLLRIERPTQLQLVGMQRVLDAAAEEIDWELEYTAAAPAPSPVPALVTEVNLERAVEHWRQTQSPFGVIGLGGEGVPVIAARDSWYRHARKLAPLKVNQGVA
jgi:hypothetical protein